MYTYVCVWGGVCVIGFICMYLFISTINVGCDAKPVATIIPQANE